MGYEPRVALLAYSNFGHPPGERAKFVRDAVRVLDERATDFEYDGEMTADVALNPSALAQYPFCRLSEPANVLIMPDFNTASISTDMLKVLGGSTVLGPLLVGLSKPVQIATLGCTDANVESSYIDGGIDTSTAEKMTATTCGIELPRCVRVTASAGDALRGARRASAGWVGSWCPVLRWRWWQCTRCGGSRV